MNCGFEEYLIMVGIRAEESFTYQDEDLFEHIDYFKKCKKNGDSPYIALTMLYTYLAEVKKESLAEKLNKLATGTSSWIDTKRKYLTDEKKKEAIRIEKEKRTKNKQS